MKEAHFTAWTPAGIIRWLEVHDPDLEEVIKRVHQSRDTYLKWGRNTLGWAVYLFRKAP